MPQDNGSEPVIDADAEHYFVRITPTDPKDAEEITCGFVGPLPRNLADEFVTVSNASGAPYTADVLTYAQVQEITAEFGRNNPDGGVLKIPLSSNPQNREAGHA